MFMMRIIFAVSIWLLITATPAFAAQKGPKAGHQPKTHTVSKSQAPKPQVKTTVKTHTKTNVKPSKAAAPKLKTAKVKSVTVKTTETRTPRTTTTATTTTTTAPGTLSPVQQKLQKNTNLAAKLQSRLPPGTDLMRASAGFRNLGQFVATVNASYNHGLSFVELKRRIVGQGMSLGQASKDLRQ